MVRLALALLPIVLACSEAAAQSVPATDTTCTCRANGRRVALGDMVCLDTADGPRLAMCVMNQNLPFYSFTKQGCIVSSLSRRPPL
jgi:hypothetical protein